MTSIQFAEAAVRVPLPGGGQREILAPTTLTLTERRVAVIGANGSGKSTLARLVNGLVRASSGRVTVDGINVVKRHRRQTQTTEGGIISFAAPIHHSKVMLIDPKTNIPTRVRRRVDTDGTVERIAKSGEPIPRTR